MTFRRFYLTAFVLIILSFAATAVLLPGLPSSVATRWTPDGTVLSSGSRFILLATAGLPLLSLWLIYKTPSVSPSGNTHKKHTYAYSITIGFFLFFLIGIHWVIVLFNFGIHIQTALAARLVIAMALFITGWVLPKIRFNHSVGIRTPWSINDETIWKKTHAAGRNLFYAAGGMFIVSSFFTGAAAFWIGAAALISVVVLLYLYSYILGKQKSDT